MVSAPGSILNSTLVMILAGGQGERLYPLTRDRAKPAVPFGGIYRIVDFTLSNCLNSGLRRVYVLTQYKSISLDRHIRRGWNLFSDELGEFVYTVPPQQRIAEHWYRGTADAIYQNIYTLEQERPLRVLILAGDHVYKMDYGDMLAFHAENDAALTVAAVEVEVERASQLGVMEVDAASRIIGFEEKPTIPRPSPEDPGRALASMGIYVFDTEVLVRAIVDDAKRDSAHDFGKNIVPDMVPSGRAFAYRFRGFGEPGPGYWRDIGMTDAYWEANMDLVGPSPQFDLYDPNWPIRTYQEQYPPARVLSPDGGPTGVVVDSILSGGSLVLGGTVKHSVLSPGVVVHAAAHIEDSILMEGVEVLRSATIRRTIVDKETVLPEGCEVGYDRAQDTRRFTVTPGGVTVVPKGVPIV